MRKLRPEIVHILSSVSSFDYLYVKLIQTLGALVVYTVHTPYDAKWSRWQHRVNRLLYRTVDLTVVHSASSFPRLAGYYRVERAKIVEVPHPSHYPLAASRMLPQAAAKASLGLPVGAQTILSFGKITPRKRLDLAIAAHARLCGERTDTYLIIAGEPQTDVAPFLDQMKRLNTSGRTILEFGRIPFDRMCVYFSAADVVALPYEGAYQSGVMQWAYAFARPVVVAGVGGLQESVAADRTGLIARKDDAGDLAQALRVLLGDARLAREMGSRALHVAQTKYGWAVVSEKLDSAYRGRLGRAPGV